MSCCIEVLSRNPRQIVNYVSVHYGMQKTTQFFFQIHQISILEFKAESDPLHRNEIQSKFDFEVQRELQCKYRIFQTA